MTAYLSYLVRSMEANLAMLQIRLNAGIASSSHGV